MFELYQLEKTAKDAYANFRFPQGWNKFWNPWCSLSDGLIVVTALDRFAKVTLSSFYLDITKDTLYADFAESPQRRSVIWVMNEVCSAPTFPTSSRTHKYQVLHTMKMVMAPILPHLAEEIHDASQGLSGSSTENHPSVFVEGWRSVVRTPLEVFVDFR